MIDFREKAQMFYARCQRIPQPAESMPKRDYSKYESPSYIRMNRDVVFRWVKDATPKRVRKTMEQNT